MVIVVYYAHHNTHLLVCFLDFVVVALGTLGVLGVLGTLGTLGILETLGFVIKFSVCFLV